MFADFQQYYGLDLETLLKGGEFARARTLASQLPRESRTVRAVDPRAEWGQTEHFLALIADHLAFLRYEQAGGKGKKPKPLPRPKPKPSKRKLDLTAQQRHSLLFSPRA